MDRHLNKKFKLICFQDDEHIYCAPYNDNVENITEYMVAANDADSVEENDYIPVISLELLKLRYVKIFAFQLRFFVSVSLLLLMVLSLSIALIFDYIYIQKIPFIFLFLMCAIHLIIYLFYEPDKIIDSEGRYINLKTGENNIGDGRLIIDTHFPDNSFYESH